jgi:two-component system, NarL family, response regulator YdfI
MCDCRTQRKIDIVEDEMANTLIDFSNSLADAVERAGQSVVGVLEGGQRGRRALHSGVRAVLPRDATGPEIMAAIEGAAAGLIVLSSEDMDALLPADAEVVPADVIPGEALSSREVEVLAMLAEGLGNKDIAARLNISEHTVKFHVSSILGKLRATTRGEAVARGVREGLVVI